MNDDLKELLKRELKSAQKHFEAGRQREDWRRIEEVTMLINECRKVKSADRISNQLHELSEAVRAVARQLWSSK